MKSLLKHSPDLFIFENRVCELPLIIVAAKYNICLIYNEPDFKRLKASENFFRCNLAKLHLEFSYSYPSIFQITKL